MDPVKQNRLFELLEKMSSGLLSNDHHQELEEILLNDPESQQIYADYLGFQHSLDQHFQTQIVEESELVQSTIQPTSRPATQNSSNRWLVALVLALLLMLTTSWIGWWQTGTSENAPITQQQDRLPTVTEELEAVASFLQLADARFLSGQTVWKMGDQLIADRELALRSGMVKLQASGGAEVILEGPAVFEWKSPLVLVMKYGRCSVHVPEEADKIEVQTPASRVVDLGTSFAIDVSETGATEVQLIEGMADVYLPESTTDKNLDGSKVTAAQPERLVKGEARQYSREERTDSVAIPFNQKIFRKQLPDRIVSYQAQETGNGVNLLEGITVQRAGELYDYQVDELIGIEVVHFKGIKSSGYLTVELSEADQGDALLAPGGRHALLDGDINLATGVINQGGGELPLDGSPVMNLTEDPTNPNTPGLGIRFREPVVNGPGPDVVLFDLQVIVHPEQGDPFRVSPLQWEAGLQSHTIPKFDITLSSPEAKLLAPFRLVLLKERANSLDELENFPFKSRIEHIVRAKALAVGIDLSDLGYADNAEVGGLFIQDIMDEKAHLDPVFIGGFPNVAE